MVGVMASALAAGLCSNLSVDDGNMMWLGGLRNGCGMSLIPGLALMQYGFLRVRRRNDKHRFKANPTGGTGRANIRLMGVIPKQMAPTRKLAPFRDSLPYLHMQLL